MDAELLGIVATQIAASIIGGPDTIDPDAVARDVLAAIAERAALIGRDDALHVYNVLMATHKVAAARTVLAALKSAG